MHKDIVHLLLMIGCGWFAACGETDPRGNDTEQGETDSNPDEGPDAGADSGLEDRCAVTDTDPDFVSDIGCMDDYRAVAAAPLTAGIPGALSAKTVIDRMDGRNLYFQNSRRYPIHYDFASTHLSGNGLPPITSLTQFNEREYYSPDRRFLLGALTYYEGPGAWTYEIAPYDTADAEMIRTAYEKIREHFLINAPLKVHPTSDSVEREVAKLEGDIPVISTDTLFEGIRYQPLNLATAVGRLVFFTKEALQDEYLSFRDIAVLNAIPNDISVCSGTITGDFQTPLSHINVLAQNRGTPNMALRGAFDDPELRALEGEWVSLTVGPQRFEVHRVTKEEADAWWEANKPQEIILPTADLSVTDLRDIEAVLDIDNLGLEGALASAIPAFGGKASHFAAFPHIETVDIPYPKAFAVPIYYYMQFMADHGFDSRLESLFADEAFQSDPAVREAALKTLQADMKTAELDPVFEAMLIDKIESDYPGVRLKFRSSTNCEDLGGFTGAGLYTSQAADLNDPEKPVADAVRTVWASVWNFRAFEERDYRSISHNDVGMALLVHRSYPAEAVNGVAITANIFDTYGMEPAYYINAQADEVSVVLPPPGVSSDQLLYHYDMPGQPIEFLGHSNLVPEGESVMSRAQTATLAESLAAIHLFFNPLYGPNTSDHFYAMDVEFKFNSDDDSPPTLVIKQARPYPGRGQGK